MEAVSERDGRENYDWWLFGVTLVLVILGMAIVLEASSARAFQSGSLRHDMLYFFKRQVMWGIAALGTLWLGMRTPYWRLRRFWLIGVAAAVTLLILVMIPHVGIEVNGARRWLGFGFMRLQPSEFAKIALVLFLARYSDLWRGRITHLSKGFIPAALVVFMIGGLVAKEDLGTAITIITTGLLMIFMMGAKREHMAGLVLVALLVGVGFLLHEPYRMKRVWAWLSLIFNPLAIHDGPEYQPWLGLIALGSGGISGQGIGRGSVRHSYLPAEHTDYIFATMGEEVGLLGCLLLLGGFAVLIIRGLTVAHRSRDWFGSLVAAGFTAMIGIQAVLNIAVVTCLVPCTGVPLPFISYGGSSLLFTALAVGIVLNISQYPHLPAAEIKEKSPHESRADGWRNGRAHLSRT